MNTQHPSMKDRATLGIKERAAIGGHERVNGPSKKAKGMGGRPPIWPVGTKVERMSLRLPADMVKQIRLLAIERGIEPAVLVAEILLSNLKAGKLGESPKP